MKISFLLYPTQKVKVDEDSSFWVFHELQKRGHEVSAFESSDLEWRDGRAMAHLTDYRTDPRAGYGAVRRRKVPTDLSSLDVLFIRKEPPFDTEYLYALQLLSTLPNKLFILNDPGGIALSNEKLFILEFPEFIPESFVTSCAEEARKFVRQLKTRVVLKPLDQKGGAGIVATSFKDRNLPSLLEQATRHNTSKIILQRFISHDKTGDKRILLLNGDLLGAFLRRPGNADFRANLGVGGTFHRAKVTPAERAMIEKMRGKLLSRGLYFVGLDVINGYLSEINVTSPSGIPELRALEGVRAEKKVADFIERRR